MFCVAAFEKARKATLLPTSLTKFKFVSFVVASPPRSVVDGLPPAPSRVILVSHGFFQRAFCIISCFLEILKIVRSASKMHLSYSVTRVVGSAFFV